MFKQVILNRNTEEAFMQEQVNLALCKLELYLLLISSLPIHDRISVQHKLTCIE